MKFRISLPLLLACFAFLSFSQNAVAQMPVSNDAKLIESISPTEVMVEATGEFVSDAEGGGFMGSKTNAQKEVEEKGVEMAVKDAKKAAVYFLLYNSTDAILGTAEERDKFRRIEEDFFRIDNIERFVTFEEQRVRSSVKIKDGEGIRVTKRFKINKERLKEALEQRDIIQATSDLTSELGNPFVAVLPAVGEDENPISVLKNNQMAKQGVAAIESYLTARQYDVVVPEQQQQLNDLASAQNMAAGNEQDIAYQLALSIGSDVYITFSGSVESAAYGGKKVAAQVRAFETTTGRLLGSETGYSKGGDRAVSVQVEEAINDAIDKVLNRVNNYWADDLQRGIQYKVIFNISPDFDEREAEDISFAILDAVDEVAKDSKQNVFTSQTVDMLIWCNPEDYEQSIRVYQGLRRYFRYSGARLSRNNINRKMLMLDITYE
jgi:hypothetical protein